MTVAGRDAAGWSRPGEAGLALTAYLVTVAALIPVSGWLGARFGGRRVFLLAVAGFVGASVLCGLSTSLAMLVAGRVVQGVAGAMMVPVGRFIVLAGTAKTDLVRAVACLGAVPVAVGAAPPGHVQVDPDAERRLEDALSDALDGVAVLQDSTVVRDTVGQWVIGRS
ncbi:MFS transporter [Dactylosporangium aurantiacum]|uniref:MFS transporter n=1 Tax=Dactylosporangium aurantiacum TaxID=35754 RepID=A0A9Q9IDY6_9ACTN|nr:MFS transporter [Dactylosporangium aurantiacum]MDG6107137.1 MFS transporter [Dactylosporangium aurantiacum]UWZ51433.1 MFS transporter [Dactylosporangium aurantiacum]